jgi:ABC-2 type transport system ATP-binding protein
VLHRGRLVAQGPVDELTAAADTPVRVRSADPGRLAEALAARGVAASEDGPGWLLVHRTTAESVGAAAAAHRIAIYEMAARPRTLEDIFLNLTGEADR